MRSEKLGASKGEMGRRDHASVQLVAISRTRTTWSSTAGAHWVGISYLQWLSCGRMQVSLEEASEKLPELISLVERGESITITRNQIPVAEALVCWNYVRGLSCERMEVSVEEARQKLPELITLVERGEFITITRDEVPVADLMPTLAREG